MKKISLNKTELNKNSASCVVNEYDFKDKEIDFSVGKINGRYPDTGFCVNEKVKELVYCISGKGKLFKTDGSCVEFKQSDAILIDKNEPYYWIAHCTVSMSCTPAWTKEQHRLIEG